MSQITTIVVIAFILGLLVLIYLVEERRNERKTRNWLRSVYGKNPDDAEGYDLKNEEDISIYYNVVKEKIPDDEVVDDITWNDLEMNRIFNRLNTTQSFVGEQVLFCELHKILKDKNKLKMRGKIIEFYSANAEKRENAQILLGNMKKDKVNYYLPLYINSIEAQKIPFIWVCRVLLCSLLLLGISALITMNQLVIGAAAVNFLINIALYAVGKSRYEVFMESLHGIIYTVKVSKSLSADNESNHIETETTVSENVKKLDKISKMIGTLERKKQASISGDIAGLISDYLIGALMWDFIVYDKVIRHLMGKQNEFMELYQFVGEIDMCIAIASFRESLTEYCIPEFEKKELLMEEIYHPLIDEPIKNSLNMRKNILLTGSNASGKSTFVKSIAINLILGQSIHTCTAKRMMIPDSRVITSMAVRDDILSGESYYMKEIKYLKRMINKSNGERMLICGIDEILRGTNTMERVAASIAILDYLYEKNCLIMVASHDLELAKTLADKYENYYFRETLKKGDVVFDYKLRKGISNSHNAIQLLQTVGFPEEIVTNARKRCVSK